MSKRQSGGDKHLGNTKDGTQSFTITQSANLLDACLNRGRFVYSLCRMEKKKIANRTDWKTGAGNLQRDSVFKETCHRWQRKVDGRLLLLVSC